jgi:hypothetical protein
MAGTVKVHVWGGIGSQLHAIFLLKSLQSYFPKKHFVFFHHEYKNYPFRMSTLEPEVRFFYPGHTYCVSRDIQMPSPVVESIGAMRAFLLKDRFANFLSKKVLRRTLYAIGLYWEPKSFQLIPKLPRVCTDIVGHYSELRFPISLYDELLNKITPISKSATFFVHYRSGDLNLFGKTEISFSRIVNLLGNLSTSPGESLIVYSENEFMSQEDSAHLSKRFLLENIGIDLGVENFFTQSVNAGNFIGTNSKASLWIAMLRCIQGHCDSTFLPISMRENFRQFQPMESTFEPRYY